MKRKLLYIDFSETATHADNLYTLTRFLSDYSVSYVLNESYQKYIPESMGSAPIQWTPRAKGLRADVKTVFLAVKKYLQTKPEIVFVNGAQGNRTRGFTLVLLAAKAQFIGLHHNAEKLLKGRSQSLINLKIKRYFVLADFIRDNLQPRLSVRLQSIYPILDVHPKLKVERDFSLLRIAIPGGLEQSRRDYSGLQKILESCPTDLSQVEFVFVGNAGTREGQIIQQYFNEKKGGARFQFFNRFLSFDEMFAQIAACDLILPLVHPGLPHFDEYSESKITGSLSLALGFFKPLLMHEALNALSDYQKFSFFYNESTLISTLRELSQERGGIDRIAQDMRSSPELSYEFQRVKFQKFLTNSGGSV